MQGVSNLIQLMNDPLNVFDFEVSLRSKKLNSELLSACVVSYSVGKETLRVKFFEATTEDTTTLSEISGLSPGDDVYVNIFLNNARQEPEVIMYHECEYSHFEISGDYGVDGDKARVLRFDAVFFIEKQEVIRQK